LSSLSYLGGRDHERDYERRYLMYRGISGISNLYGSIRTTPRPYMTRGSLPRYGMDGYWRLWDLIYHYSSRQITYATDAVRAFAGIQSFFDTRWFPVHNFQGLPALRIRQNVFVALCWTHETARIAHRRPSFPSWTWAGWESAVLFPWFRFNATQVEYNCSIAMAFGYANGRWYDLHLVAIFLSRAQSYQVSLQHIETYPLVVPAILEAETALIRAIQKPTVISLRAALLDISAFFFGDLDDWATCSFIGAQLHMDGRRLGNDRHGTFSYLLQKRFCRPNTWLCPSSNRWAYLLRTSTYLACTMDR
jgi:hypothetical protein